MRIDSLLAELRIPTRTVGQHEHAREGWVQIDCPRCSPRSGRFRLGINVSGGYANCWSCGSIRLVDALSETTHLSVLECYDLLKSVGWERNRKWAERLAGKLKIPPGVGLLAKAHRKYLQGRGFDPDRIARLWGVQGIGIAARYSWSLFIPIQYRGETVSWTTRSIGDKGKRYSNAPVAEEAIPAKELLYGNDLARQCIIIVEGPADAWAIGPGAVATMGLNYTPAQLNKMIKYPVRVVCFDSETQAQWRANRLADELARYSGETHRVKLETGKDAAEADSDEIAELRKRFLVE